MDPEDAFFLLGTCYAGRAWILSGIETNPAFGQVFDKDLEIRVDTLPTLVAPSKDPMDVLVTSLAIVFHDTEICCGKDSALGDRVQTTDPKSLKNVASKLNGRSFAERWTTVRDYRRLHGSGLDELGYTLV